MSTIQCGHPRDMVLYHPLLSDPTATGFTQAPLLPRGLLQEISK